MNDAIAFAMHDQRTILTYPLGLAHELVRDLKDGNALHAIRDVFAKSARNGPRQSDACVEHGLYFNV